MFRAVLSNDLPRSRTLAALLVVILAGLIATPFLFPGAQALALAAKILVYVVLVASFDLLLGYTGIASFAHTMFFGIGAYGVAIASVRMGPSWSAVLVGTVAALAVSLVLSAAIGLVTLRVRAIFFAMITLALAASFQTLVAKLTRLTGGGDGLNFELPAILSSSHRLLATPVFGVTFNGRILTFYVVLVVSVALFLVLLRIVNSTFGRALQALRENDFRAEAIGFPVTVYRTVSSVMAALFATLAGVLFAMWLGYNGPGATLSFEIMVNVLLMLVIGGMGTMYGAVIGVTLFLIAESYLRTALQLANNALEGVPVLASLSSPDSWLLWLGVMFVLSVYFFPNGIVGRLRGR